MESTRHNAFGLRPDRSGPEGQPGPDPHGGRDPHLLAATADAASYGQGADALIDSGASRPQAARASKTKPLKGRNSGARRSFWNSLTVRIALLNLISLLIFLVGLIASSQYRSSSVDERLIALRTHSQFMAGVLEQTALTIRLGRSGSEEPYEAIDRIAAIDILRRLVVETEYRARIYDYDGSLIYDSWLLDEEGQVTARNLERDGESGAGFLRTLFDTTIHSLLGPRLDPAPEDLSAPLPELSAALAGGDAPDELQSVRYEDGNIIVSVAAPVRNVSAHVGAILMSTQGDDFEAVLWRDRRAIFQVFLLALIVNVLVAVGHANTIARPISRLARAADSIRSSRARTGLAGRAKLPEFRKRSDEIGDLAASFADMTEALNKRLVAIEQFAADVSHEIKTPLTSLRSAVETLDLAVSEDARLRLIAVIKHDVDRLDRLITDISNASRLDAELSREDSALVNVPVLVQEILKVYQVSGTPRDVRLSCDVRAGAFGTADLSIQGIESRIGQVFNNLIENAMSFSPEGGEVRISTAMERADGQSYVLTSVEDEGPGIPDDSLEKIFERFYTQRPEEDAFGQNSGLGLSISKQIVEAHGGTIWAENRLGQDGRVEGARFLVRLPSSDHG